MVLKVIYVVGIFALTCSGQETDPCDGIGCNPDQYLTTAQIIRRYGYASESHTIETRDGFLLTLHRIPASRNGTLGRQPVFLQHGLLGSSADWVTLGNKSLAFLLSDMGYDVWLGNARGNTYSKGHVNYTIDDARFWNFSWHDMAIHDLPAAFNHISNTTGKPGDIIYVGHSMGTTMFFVLSSVLPQVAKNVKIMIALAPVAYMTHIRSPIRYLCPFVDNIQWLTKYLGVNQFLPSNKILKFLAYDCELFKIDKLICEDVIFSICGFDKDQFDEKLLPVVLGHIPAGSSTKTVLHYLQEINHNGDFRQYDYGTAGNMIQYGTPTPPSYKLGNIKVPTYLMYGDNDWLASPIDVKRLASNLTANVGVYEVPLANFNHVDFLWGKDAPTLVYQQLLKVIRDVDSNYV